MKNLVLRALVLIAALAISSAENQYCTDSGCDIPGSKSGTSNVVESDKGELDTVPDSSTQQWDVLSTIGGILTSVKDTVLYNLYTKPMEFAKSVYDQATEYAEKVRSVFREEFHKFLEVLWEAGVGIDPKSGKAFTIHLYRYKKL